MQLSPSVSSLFQTEQKIVTWSVYSMMELRLWILALAIAALFCGGKFNSRSTSFRGACVIIWKEAWVSYRIKTSSWLRRSIRLAYQGRIAANTYTSSCLARSIRYCCTRSLRTWLACKSLVKFARKNNVALVHREQYVTVHCLVQQTLQRPSPFNLSQANTVLLHVACYYTYFLSSLCYYFFIDS